MNFAETVSAALICNYWKRNDSYDGWWVVGLESCDYSGHRLDISAITVTRLQPGYLS